LELAAQERDEQMERKLRVDLDSYQRDAAQMQPQ
jgi:hypothetical protein